MADCCSLHVFSFGSLDTPLSMTVRFRGVLACLQIVQYIQPQHHAQLGQAELLVIDEAAAIPLPLVKSMLGPYLVFLCSTVNGYEGHWEEPLPETAAAAAGRGSVAHLRSTGKAGPHCPVPAACTQDLEALLRWASAYVVSLLLLVLAKVGSSCWQVGTTSVSQQALCRVAARNDRRLCA